eukprot:5439196-Prymnesium_polylepis.1
MPTALVPPPRGRGATQETGRTDVSLAPQHSPEHRAVEAAAQSPPPPPPPQHAEGRSSLQHRECRCLRRARPRATRQVARPEECCK